MKERRLITVPYQHQMSAAKKMFGMAAFALFADMGTGKSLLCVWEFANGIIDGELDCMVIIAPKGAYLNWQTELKDHLHTEIYKRLAIFVWKSAGSNKELKNFMKVNSNRARVLIINVEAFGRTERASDIVARFMAGRQTLLVIDESTTIKSTRAKRTAALIALGAFATRRRILTGLPTPQSPLDLYAQFNFLDPKILNFPNFITFRARYAKFKTVQTGQLESYWFNGEKKWRRKKIQAVSGYRNAGDLQRKIEPFVFRVRKEDCLDLPERVYQWRDVEMTPEQRRELKELREQATTQLDAGGYVTATIVLTRMIRLQHILCGFVQNDEGIIRPVESNRLDVLMELLADLDGRAIIWTNWNFCINEISERIISEYGKVARFYGGNPNTRQAEIAQWRTDPDCRFLVASQGAGGMGNTWVEGNYNIYYSNSYNLQHRLQSEDRIHRSGQVLTCFNIDLVCRGTSDEKIIMALRKKLDLATIIMNDNWREWVI